MAVCSECSESKKQIQALELRLRKEPGFEPPARAVQAWINLFPSSPEAKKGSLRQSIASLIYDSFDQPMLAGERGAAAARRPSLYRAGDIGLDVKIEPSLPGGGFRLRGRGWETDGGDLWDVLERLDREGTPRFVVTDVTKDGTLNGPNLELLSKVTERTDAPVIASGGVSSLDDLRAIATLTDRGVEGAIVGKALYAGRFTLPQALAAVAQ